MKICTKCGENEKRKGSSPWCQTCHQKYERNRWNKLSVEKKRGKWLKHKYGLSWEEYETMYKFQEGLCAICSVEISITQTDNSRTTACVDHCHTTNKVRGLLCNHCNRALGLMNDNQKAILKMVQYLDKYNQTEK